MYSSIVVGVDASERSLKALDQAAELAGLTGAKLHIVCAYVPLNDAEVFERTRGLNPQAAAKVDEDFDVKALASGAVDRAKRAGVEPKRHLIVGTAAEVLVKSATDIGADLIVVGNRGMAGVRRVLGSVPNHVAHHAPCSVLIVDTSD
jgi:nucleotide-binding universal stress UspA family protein